MKIGRCVEDVVDWKLVNSVQLGAVGERVEAVRL
jgi:hypothetical protein